MVVLKLTLNNSSIHFLFTVKITENTHLLLNRYINIQVFCNISAIALANGVEKVTDRKNCSKTVTAQAIISHSASAPTMGFAQIIGWFHISAVIPFNLIFL